jgi:RND family efflux transporter MFP subunit
MKKFITILFVLAAATGCAGNKNKEVLRPVKTYTVHTAIDSMGKSFPTKAMAASDVNLSFDYPGTIRKIYVNVGDKVRRGQIIAEIDGRDFVQALNAARADYEIARSTYERVRNAAEANAVSKQDLDNARTKFEQAQAQLAVKQKAFGSTRITAPFNGEVTGKFVNEFTNIGAGMPVVRIINADSIDLPVSLPESIMMRWNADIDKVDIFAVFDAFPGREFPVAVKNRSAEADPYTGAYNVTLTLPQPADVRIMPGNVGQVVVRLKKDADIPEADYIIIPVSAVKADGEQPFVFTVDTANSTVKATPVTIKEATVNGLAVDGLTDGTVIVAAGVDMLHDGQKVKISAAVPTDTETTEDEENGALY